MQKSWLPFTGNEWLTAGDEVTVVSHAGRNLGSKTGIVKRRLRKNVLVLVDGRKWRIPPSLIGSYRQGNPANLPQAKEVVVKCNPEGLKDCKVGDTILMWRGKFDVVKIVSLTPKFDCQVLDGRSKGEIFSYKPAWFVQKLDSNRFGDV